ncbi:hypothetical protein Q73A0000_01245 [Kaistella flava (ex Peng et al. 2021)]|uniref:Uncharacterized protein n=1 Tax=Kaistella flava (ex Peng et al. 2021) TaxID=2038776 RepID=A0A7M2Y4A8_9FLAO|nr:hypothetical protein [Kaistella flava (ex Peng et al. 2021)]QOW09068.1 hypothetical protein Q73A0000_01245 [Kaistella flava (ex Peng et al. 2021)]
MTTITKPEISPELLAALQPKVEAEKQVIVHCCFPGTPFSDMLIRIWSSTFLIDESLGHKSTLIHHENISLFPYWTEVPPMKDYWFTLVFSGLPKECTSFDLKEEIPQEGGFWVRNIKRNKSDVYKVKIN